MLVYVGLDLGVNPSSEEVTDSKSFVLPTIRRGPSEATEAENGDGIIEIGVNREGIEGLEWRRWNFLTWNPQVRPLSMHGVPERQARPPRCCLLCYVKLIHGLLVREESPEA